MGNQHLVYERYIWFDAEIHRGRFPNASTLADHFEISRRTARRNIAFMRDMLDAPLAYDQTRRGYTYEMPFTLPDLPVSQEEQRLHRPGHPPLWAQTLRQDRRHRPFGAARPAMLLGHVAQLFTKRSPHIPQGVPGPAD